METLGSVGIALAESLALLGIANPSRVLGVVGLRLIGDAPQEIAEVIAPNGGLFLVREAAIWQAANPVC